MRKIICFKERTTRQSSLERKSYKKSSIPCEVGVGGVDLKLLADFQLAELVCCSLSCFESSNVSFCFCLCLHLVLLVFGCDT
jgi:hypothetical protein